MIKINNYLYQKITRCTNVFILVYTMISYISQYVSWI
jgi:hypothetical protein